jgi:hypothetical protein
VIPGVCGGLVLAAVLIRTMENVMGKPDGGDTVGVRVEAIS